MITLGKWDNQVGSDFTQAATLFHELGHNLGLRHGPTAKSANCEPNFLSSMNYLYQTAGLLDGKGSPQIDYSRQELPNLTEGSLSDAAGFGVATLPFQARWYVPMGSSPLLRVLGTNVATHHCNGTPKLPTENMIRVESGTLVGKPVDWDQDGQSDSGFAQDLDFDGKSNEPAFTGFNDWTHIDLKQIGGRRNVIKLSLGILKQDLAAGDSGLGDSGLGDSGLGDSGLGDSGLGDSGLGANAGDSGLGDSGLGDSGLGIELDYETASDGSAPNSLTATAGKQSITLNWNASNVTTAVKYSIYRAIDAISPTNLPTLIGTVVGAPPLTTFVDNDVKNNVTYSYVVVMTDSKATQSGPSNAVTIKK